LKEAKRIYQKKKKSEYRLKKKLSSKTIRH